MGLVPPKFIQGRVLVDHPYARVVEDFYEGRDHGYLEINFPEDWCATVAFDEQGDMILVRQFRFGTRSFELEFPGGGCKRGADPLEEAKRELLEETGYVGREWTKLGVISPNPATQDNSSHIFLATGCHKVGDQQPDGDEEIEIDVLPTEIVANYVRSGIIRHAIMLAALQLYSLYRLD